MNKAVSIDKIKIGNFLYTLRKEKNISQGQLGIILGVTNKAVSKWENGDNEPEITMLYKLADVYDVSVDEIIKGERNKPVDPLKEEIEKDILQRRINEIENQRQRKARYYFIVKLFLLTIVFGFFIFFFGTFYGNIHLGGHQPLLDFIKGIAFYVAFPLGLVSAVTGFELMEKILPQINPSITIVALTILPVTLSTFLILGFIDTIPSMIQEQRLAYKNKNHFLRENQSFLKKILFIYLSLFIIHIILSICFHLFLEEQMVLETNLILVISLFLCIAIVTIIFGYSARKKDLI